MKIVSVMLLMASAAITALIVLIVTGPIFERPWMTGPSAVQQLVDILLRLMFVGLAFMMAFIAVEQLRPDIAWANGARTISALGGGICAVALLGLIFVFHLGPKPLPLH